MIGSLFWAKKKSKKNQKKIYKRVFMQLFSADATIFLKNLPTKSWKKHSKVAQKYSKIFSPIAAQTAQIEEFMFENVTYRPTVYRTGDLTRVQTHRHGY